MIKEFSVNVYLSTKHKNKHSNCQPFDLDEDEDDGAKLSSL